MVTRSRLVEAPNHLTAALRASHWRHKARGQDWALGRIASLGQEVLKLLGPSACILNIQKGRVDYLVAVSENPGFKARTCQVARFMTRRDMVPLIAQQQQVFAWAPVRRPVALYMDSFSELTDQLFVHRRCGWRFCCNDSDLRHSPDFQRRYKAVGLLPPEQLSHQYRRFFEWIRSQYGDIPILYLHFPVKLDRRAKFHVRHGHILHTISQLSLQFPPFHSITVDDAIVDWPAVPPPGLKEFPYHYNNATYVAMAEQVRATGIFR